MLKDVQRIPSDVTQQTTCIIYQRVSLGAHNLVPLLLS